jgi:hypothetical protein
MLDQIVITFSVSAPLIAELSLLLIIQYNWNFDVG